MLLPHRTIEGVGVIESVVVIAFATCRVKVVDWLDDVPMTVPLLTLIVTVPFEMVLVVFIAGVGVGVTTVPLPAVVVLNATTEAEVLLATMSTQPKYRMTEPGRGMMRHSCPSGHQPGPSATPHRIPAGVVCVVTVLDVLALDEVVLEETKFEEVGRAVEEPAGGVAAELLALADALALLAAIGTQP